jgi:hypothetical protein
MDEEQGKTIEDIRSAEYESDASDMDVVFEEFEAILADIKRATFALKSGRGVDEAVASLREAVERTTDLQSAVLDYMAEVEEGDEESDDEAAEEDAEPGAE